MKRTTKDRPKARRTESTSAAASRDRKAEGEALVAELDSLLDDIDDVLEENAEEFVRGYIQQGGE